MPTSRGTGKSTSPNIKSSLTKASNAWQQTWPPAWPSIANKVKSGHLCPLHWCFPLELSTMMDMIPVCPVQ